MERDFSESTKQALIRFFSNKENLYNDDVSEDNLLGCQVASNVDFDIFADEIETYSSSANNGIVFADIQLLGLISKINFVFEEAQQLDTNFSGLVNIHATAATENYITGLQAMADAISLDGLGDTEAEILCNLGKKGSSGVFGDANYCKNALNDVDIPNKEYAYMLGLTSEDAADKYINALVASQDNVCNLSDEEKQQIITLYELYHKEHQDNIDDFLAPIQWKGYTQEAIDIKVISYTAPEPYRTLFLDNVKDIEVIETEYRGTEYYKSDGHCLYLNVSSWQGDYTTLFHECGHALDDLLVEDGELSTTYSKDGKFLINVLETDVRSVVTASVDEKMAEEGITEADRPKMREEIVEGIMNCCDEDYDKPVFDKRTSEVYEAVIDDVKSGNTATSSDIYGGYTGNLLQNGAGHSALRKNEDDYYYYSYWTLGEYNESTHEYTIKYSQDGTIEYSTMLPVEFFAENFAAQMTRDPGELDGIYGISDASGNRDGRFNESIPFMEEMIQDAYENMN